MTIILDGKKLAKQKRQQLKEEIISHCQTLAAPKLAAIIIGNDPASAIYVKNKIKACNDVGIDSLVITKDESLSQERLLNIIDELNDDDSINGILVQLPLPPQIKSQNIIERIDPSKDVDGFHPYNIGRLALRQPALRPCTPYGIMQLLKAYDLSSRGLNATIIGVSNIVGRPLALELLLAGATVSSCHRHTKNLEKHIKDADLVISATGQRGIFNESLIAKHAIVIDVGIHRINNKLCGDLNFDLLNGQVEYLTPVPGGVGPMTITALLQNTFQAAVLQQTKL